MKIEDFMYLVNKAREDGVTSIPEFAKYYNYFKKLQ